MKKLLLAAVFVTLGSAAFAFGPSPDDAHPPGALFASQPYNRMYYSAIYNPYAGTWMTTPDVRPRKHQRRR
jgi:hypothetical protein